MPKSDSLSRRCSERVHCNVSEAGGSKGIHVKGTGKTGECWRFSIRRTHTDRMADKAAPTESFTAALIASLVLLFCCFVVPTRKRVYAHIEQSRA